MNIAEINMVTSDAAAAATMYKHVFGFDIESSSEETGDMSEVRISLNGVVIQILNENQDFGLVAPTAETVSSMWINVLADDIHATFDKAKENGFGVIAEVTEYAPNMKNAVVRDTFNHVWVLNQK